ncbi:MAG: GTP cyclohydrolase I FolE [Flavobacteriales bacterium]
MINGTHTQTPSVLNGKNANGHTSGQAPQPVTDTPLRPGAFECSDEEKIERISEKFSEIMDILGLDLNDDSLRGTPGRVARMYVNEVFSGLNPVNRPEITLFENPYAYRDMLVERNIRFYSHCEHHFVPFFGFAHVAYISSGKIIGLSKLNRLVQFYARRPQVQERLTMQIAKGIAEALQSEHVAVVLKAEHLCVASRGIQDTHSDTVSSVFLGNFREPALQDRFWKMLES